MAGVYEQEIRALAAALEHHAVEQREVGTVNAAWLHRPCRDSAGDAVLQVVGNRGEMLTRARYTRGCGCR